MSKKLYQKIVVSIYVIKYAAIITETVSREEGMFFDNNRWLYKFDKITRGKSMSLHILVDQTKIHAC